MSLPKYRNDVEALSVTEFLLSKRHRWLANRLRHQIYVRDNYTCQYCGVVAHKILLWNNVNKKGEVLKGQGLHADAWVSEGKILTLDHIIPSCFGGTKDPNNLQTLCDTCNGEKDNRIEFDHPRIKELILVGFVLPTPSVKKKEGERTS